MRQRLSLVAPALLCSVVTVLLAGAGPVLAGAHAGAGGKPKPIPTPDAFYEHTGFEGREQVLTDAVVKAVREAKPNNGETLNFTPDQQRMLGLAVAKAIKTISNDTPYQHEMNDALVKAHLTNIQFAKDNGLLKEMIDHEVKTQSFMIQLGAFTDLSSVPPIPSESDVYQPARLQRVGFSGSLVFHNQRRGIALGLIGVLARGDAQAVDFSALPATSDPLFYRTAAEGRTIYLSITGATQLIQDLTNAASERIREEEAPPSEGGEERPNLFTNVDLRPRRPAPSSVGP